MRKYVIAMCGGVNPFFRDLWRLLDTDAGNPVQKNSARAVMEPDAAVLREGVESLSRAVCLRIVANAERLQGRQFSAAPQNSHIRVVKRLSDEQLKSLGRLCLQAVGW